MIPSTTITTNIMVTVIAMTMTMAIPIHIHITAISIIVGEAIALHIIATTPTLIITPTPTIMPTVIRSVAVTATAMGLSTTMAIDASSGSYTSLLRKTQICQMSIPVWPIT